MSATTLEVRGLTVHYPQQRGADDVSPALNGISFDLRPGETVAIVGESGSGKSTLLHALLGLLPRESVAGFDDIRVAGASVDDVQALRGSGVGIVPQDPTTALDPLVRIGAHFREAHRYVAGVRDREESRRRAIEALELVGLDRPVDRLRQYPHELSGGQRQRVLIALALIGEPRILLADEPTSNLDATVQKRVLDLLDELRERRNLSVLLVTHDIGVAAERSTQLVVLRGGHVIESGPTTEVITDPRDPYTQALLSALPSNLPLRTPRQPDPDEKPVLVAEGLSKSFPAGRGRERVLAVEDLAVTVHRGRTVAIVGESGAGKSTALRLLTGLDAPDRGEVTIDTVSISARHRARGVLAAGVQIVYQNPGRSLNPSLTVIQAIAEPLEADATISRDARLARAHELLEAVQLTASLASRRTGELSGGQQQRVAIARALITNPRLLVLDEPVSALDQSVQFALLSLLLDLQTRFGIAVVIVSHDLGVVRALADDIVVLHRGRVVETGRTADVFNKPSHPRTRELLDAIPAWSALTPTERKP